jgi:hypothetical protein
MYTYIIVITGVCWRPSGSITFDVIKPHGTHGGEERCIQGFSGETWGKETTWKVQA